MATFVPLNNQGTTPVVSFFHPLNPTFNMNGVGAPVIPPLTSWSMRPIFPLPALTGVGSYAMSLAPLFMPVLALLSWWLR